MSRKKKEIGAEFYTSAPIVFKGNLFQIAFGINLERHRIG